MVSAWASWPRGTRRKRSPRRGMAAFAAHLDLFPGPTSMNSDPFKRACIGVALSTVPDPRLEWRVSGGVSRPLSFPARPSFPPPISPCLHIRAGSTDCQGKTHLSAAFGSISKAFPWISPKPRSSIRLSEPIWPSCPRECGRAPSKPIRRPPARRRGFQSNGDLEVVDVSDPRTRPTGARGESCGR